MSAAPLCPQSEADLAEIVAGAEGPLQVIGGGTRPVGAVAGTPLSTRALTGISLYEPGALTLVVAAGTPLAEVEATLAAEGQRLAFEPPDWRRLLGTEGTPTIGAVAAANLSGPRRVQAGACRDALLGVRVVDGRGTIIRNGGRVMKNVTGYDLVRLMAGSRGTLGILTEVALKVLPAPETEATLTLYGLDEARAQKAMARALGTPFEVSGAAHLPGHGTALRLEGFGEQVAYRAAQLARALAPFGQAHVEEDAAASAALWAAIRDVAGFADRAGDVWRISVKPSDGPRAGAAIGAEALIYDWAGGLIWALVAPGQDIRPALAGIGGHATLVRAAPETRARIASFQPEAAPVAALARGLRAQYDPRGILNPGLMG